MREGLHKVVSAEDTIVAIASPFGRSALGIVRMSGSSALPITTKLFHNATPVDRSAVVGQWHDQIGDVIDEVMVTVFHAPRSYTGEDVVEITGHGNPLTLNRIVSSIQASGARAATPGEFTLRAVAHGKLDLLQAEAVRDFIDAQTEHQARTALRQINGVLSKRVRPVQQKLVDVISRLEAGIDFVEDEIDLPDARAITADLDRMVFDLGALQATFEYGRLLHDGLRVVIVGKPNVGKSSLFNRIVSMDRAIVTDIPGTTRDVLTETVSIDGIPLKVFDTAGIRETADAVESLGVGRTVDALGDCDLAIVVVDGSAPITPEDHQTLSLVGATPHIIAINKADLPERVELDSENKALVIRLSAKTGIGLGDLEGAFRKVLAGRRSEAQTDVVLTSARQCGAVAKARTALQCAISAIARDTPDEMVLLDLYEALSGLNELTGEVVTDDILDRIFFDVLHRKVNHV